MFTARKISATLVAISSIGLSLTLATSPASSAPTNDHRPALTATKTHKVKVTGKIATKVKRKVLLQKKNLAKNKWRKVAVTISRANGRVVFKKVKLDRKAVVRFYAPATKVDGRVYRATTVNANKVTIQVPVPTKQGKGRATVLPALAAPGASPAAASNDPIVAVLNTPAVEGRTVTLQTLDSDGAWATIAKTTEDATGQSVLAAPTTGTLRAFTPAYQGAPSITTNTVQARVFDLDYSEEFAGSLGAFDDQLMGLNPNAGRTCAQPHPSQRTVNNGVLSLGASRDPSGRGVCVSSKGKFPYMLNSQVATEYNYEFTYGYAAARLKFHKNRGMHSAFWTVPAENRKVGDVDNTTEIDIAEWFGTRPNGSPGMGAFVWNLDNDGAVSKTGQVFPEATYLSDKGKDWWDAYHVFSVEWTPSAYVFRIDGREFWRQAGPTTAEPQYLVLSALTSDWELDQIDSGVLNEKLDVDWVRVWHL